MRRGDRRCPSTGLVLAVDVGRQWVEVATSTGAAVAAADGEGGSSSGEMADSSRRVRVFGRERERKGRPCRWGVTGLLLGLLTGPSSPLSLQY